MVSEELRRQVLREMARSGGRARAKNLSPEERSESAKKAANARWAKKKRKTKGKRPDA